MKREEFSQLLASIHKMAKCSKSEMREQTGMTFQQIQYIEECRNNYSLINVLKYLRVVGRIMLLKQGSEIVLVSKYEDIPEFLRKTRELKKYTQMQLAQETGYSLSTIADTENQVSAMHIDSFLAITSALKIKIELKYR